MKHVLAAVWLLVSLFSGCAIDQGKHTGGIDTRSARITPDEVVSRLNNRYTSIRDDCREFGSNQPRGHYYCSGVVIRGTDDGGFRPWEYSPISIARGSVSFSWIRRDLPPPEYHRPGFKAQGFVLWSPADEIELGRPPFDRGFICIYPFDAGTGNNMNHKGCGLRRGGAVLYPQPALTNRNSHYAWGQCEGMGITSIVQWVAFWEEQDPALPAYQREQCSWNVESREAWENAVTIIKTLTSPATYLWNEMMLDTMNDDGSILMPHIAAIWWDESHPGNGVGDALGSARTFQAKLQAQGYYAPVLRLDRVTMPDRPFSYHIEDQGTIPR